MRHIRLKYFLTIILGLLMGCSQNDPELEPVDSEFLTLGCLFQEDVQFIVETEEEYFEMVRQIFDDRIGLDCIDTTRYLSILTTIPCAADTPK